MPKRALRRDRAPKYWWSEEISILRQKFLKLRRIALRANKRDGYEVLNEEYKAA